MKSNGNQHFRRFEMRKVVVLVLAVGALILASGCATKKFVREEITTSETKTNQKIDQETNKLQGQITELSNLNKQLNSKIEQVADRASAADAKAEEAKAIGNDAKRAAEAANKGVLDLRVKLDVRSTYSVVDSKEVYFAFNRYDLSADAKSTLDALAKAAGGDKGMVLALEGYTDKVGSDTYNYELSERRVKSVVRYFVAEKGVDLNRIFTIGLGKSGLVGDNKSEDSRQKSRRVVIKVMEAK